MAMNNHSISNKRGGGGGGGVILGDMAYKEDFEIRSRIASVAPDSMHIFMKEVAGGERRQREYPFFPTLPPSPLPYMPAHQL